MKKSDSLYKYTQLKFITTTLYNGIFASRIDSLNDPYEYIGLLDKEDNDYRVVCLTRSRNKKLMWSHYANGHRGCSIKIFPPEDYGLDSCVLKRVQYTSSYSLKDKLSPNEIVESLYKKDKKWNQELEVRAVYHNSYSNDDCWKSYRNSIFYKVKIAQIDFGCSSHLDDHYLEALIAIRDYNCQHRKKIKVKKYKMSDIKYEFIYDDSFDYIKEIENLTNNKK